MPLHDVMSLSGPHVLPLVTKAQGVLLFNQRTLADAIGSSHRTVQRWSSGRAHPLVMHVRKLAVLVYPHDAPLAAELAALAGESLESLGLVPPAPAAPAQASPPAAPPPSPLLLAALAESVVAAAAEAMDVSPRVARPAVLAAAERAQSANVSIDDLVRALRPPPPPPPEVAASPPGRGKKSP
jgi:hypothetical protein